MAPNESNETDSPGIKDLALKYMGDTYDSLVQALAGIALSDRKDWALSIGFLFQRVRGGQFLKTLMIEYEKYREKGKIKDDYATTEQCQTSLQEILDCLDKDSPDEIRFSFLKKLFLSVATEELSNRDDILPQQFIRIARSLSSGEILLLMAAFKIAKESSQVRDFDTWMPRAKQSSGLQHYDLVFLHDIGLVSKRLLIERNFNFSTQPFHRLTSLGDGICRFIEHYEETVAAKNKEV